MECEFRLPCHGLPRNFWSNCSCEDKRRREPPILPVRGETQHTPLDGGGLATGSPETAIKNIDTTENEKSSQK